MFPCTSLDKLDLFVPTLFVTFCVLRGHCSLALLFQILFQYALKLLSVFLCTIVNKWLQLCIYDKSIMMIFTILLSKHYTVLFLNLVLVNEISTCLPLEESWTTVQYSMCFIFSFNIMEYSYHEWKLNCESFPNLTIYVYWGGEEFFYFIAN